MTATSRAIAPRATADASASSPSGLASLAGVGTGTGAGAGAGAGASFFSLHSFSSSFCGLGVSFSFSLVSGCSRAMLPSGVRTNQRSHETHNMWSALRGRISGVPWHRAASGHSISVIVQPCRSSCPSRSLASVILFQSRNKTHLTTFTTANNTDITILTTFPVMCCEQSPNRCLCDVCVLMLLVRTCGCVEQRMEWVTSEFPSVADSPKLFLGILTFLSFFSCKHESYET